MRQSIFRILTESKNVSLVKTSLGDLGLDYTLYSANGSWRGQEERSLIIELDNIPRELAEKAAKLIKRINRQETVLLQEIPVTSQFV
jgi:hypothetical protein